MLTHDILLAAHVCFTSAYAQHTVLKDDVHTKYSRAGNFGNLNPKRTEFGCDKPANAAGWEMICIPVRAEATRTPIPSKEGKRVPSTEKMQKP